MEWLDIFVFMARIPVAFIWILKDLMKTGTPPPFASFMLQLMMMDGIPKISDTSLMESFNENDGTSSREL